MNEEAEEQINASRYERNVNSKEYINEYKKSSIGKNIQTSTK